MHLTRERLELTEIPPRPVRELAAEALVDLRSTEERFSEFGVPMPSMSRLQQSIPILERAARTGEIAPIQRGDDLGLKALEVAFDFAAIAQYLPDPRGPVAALRKDIATALGGTLGGDGDTQRSLQMQSQLIVRSALVAAGLQPYHPTHSPQKGRKSPDLLLDNGLSSYAIEVKRPSSINALIPRLRDARDQLTGFGLRGGVVLDVTECLRNTAPGRQGTEARSLALAVMDQIFVAGHGYRPGFDGIMVAGLIARRAWTSEDGEAHTMVQVHTLTSIAIFAAVQFSLLDHRARWVREELEKGFGRLYQTLQERSGSHVEPET